MTTPGILWIIGLLFLFAGEQIFGVGLMRWGLSGLGIAVIAGAFVMRVRALSAASEATQPGHRIATLLMAVGSSAVLTYGLSTTEVMTALNLSDEAIVRWEAVFLSLTPVLFVVGATPMVFVDMVVSANPVLLPKHAVQRASIAGLTSGLAIALVFPLNYLATALDDAEYRTSYFKTTEAGESTRAIIGQLTRPVTVHLFFAAGNEVKDEIEAYLRELEASDTGDLFTVQSHDYATDLALSERLKITDNGWVVIEAAAESEGSEASTAKFKMKEELDRAKRDLKRLDSLFQKNLLKATRGTRVAYFTTGHGEASQRETGDGWRKLSNIRKDIQNQSYKLDNLSITDGLADSVPEDADLLVIASPTQPLMPEEVAAITTWMEKGGQLLVMADARSEGLDELLQWMGLQRTPGMVLDPKPRLRGAPPYFIATDRYGTHPVVTTLSAAKQPMVLPASASFTEVEGGAGKATVLVRSFGSAFADSNGNGRQDAEEESRVLNIGYAVEGGSGDSTWRAVVMGNQMAFSDNAFKAGIATGRLFVGDSLRWLEGEEATAGEITSEEDVKINHSPGGQGWYFWATIFGVPLLLLGAPIVSHIIRRRSA